MPGLNINMADHTGSGKGLSAAHPENNLLNARVCIFLAFVCFILLHHVWVFLGFYGMDDVNYSRYAARIAAGGQLEVKSDSHFELRWATIYITAFFYRLFGINDLSSSAFGILTVLTTGLLIAKMLYKAPLWVYATALVCFFLNYSTLYATHRIWPDSLVMLCSFSAFTVYLRAEGKKYQKWNAVVFGLLVFLSMITKETVLLLLPLLVVFFIRDVSSKRRMQFWLWSMVAIVLLFFLYSFFFRVMTGDWWYRYRVLLNNTVEGGCSFDTLPFSDTLKRIGYTLWQAFMLNGDLMVLLFGLCGFIYRKEIFPGKKEKETALAFFVLLLSSNFMTFSYKSYIPLCQDPRHFMLLMPFAAVSGSYALRAYCMHPARFWLIPVFLGAATLAFFVRGGGETKYVYLLVGLVLSVPIIFKRLRNSASGSLFFLLLLAGCLLIRPVYDVYINRFSFYHDHRKMISADFPDRFPNALVLTGNDTEAELSEYFLHFNTGTVTFVAIDEAGSLLQQNRTAHLYVLVNGLTNPDLSHQLHKMIRDAPESVRLIEKKGSVLLYKIDPVNNLNTGQ